MWTTGRYLIWSMYARNIVHTLIAGVSCSVPRYSSGPPIVHFE